MSQFTIALFDDGLQLVPSSWIFDNEKVCHWPPYMSEKRIQKAIIEKISPDCTWTTHKIQRVFGTSNTYESGIEKVKLAQDYSDVDTPDIDISRQQRIARQKKFKNENFVYSSASDSDQNNNIVTENQVNKKIKTLPAPPPLPKSFIVNELNNEVLQSDEEFTENQMNKKLKILSTSPPLPKSFIVNELNNEVLQSDEEFTENQINKKQKILSTPPPLPKYSNKNMNKSLTTLLDTPGKNMLPEIFRRLNQILAKLNSVDDRLRTLEENQNSIETNKEISVLQEFVSLPLKTNDEIQNMEKDLENQDFFEQMAISLNRIGGRDSHELIVNILKRSITNEVAIQYSWAGKLKKMGFKDLLLSKCIIRAVRIMDKKVTEKEIIQYISKWLVQATLRHERSLEKKTKNQQKIRNKTEDTN